MKLKKEESTKYAYMCGVLIFIVCLICKVLIFWGSRALGKSSKNSLDTYSPTTINCVTIVAIIERFLGTNTWFNYYIH